MSPFKPGRSKADPDYERLRVPLNTSEVQTKNNSLWQVISGLIDYAQQGQGTINTLIQNLTDTVNSINNSISIIIGQLIGDKTFLTATDESLSLPNSRQLLAGTNVTFDDSVANRRTVNVSAGSSVDHVVLSDGVQPPTPINDGNGNFIYIPYIP
jgi:hypothetical protein